jgi:exopolyphosphatase/guanosine-5'-triphosphate,3'-diphosphate pyrophosphatase
MIVAVIDCGTNTFNLLITRVIDRQTCEKLHNDRIAVRLGEGSINAGYISDVPYQRGLSAMKKFQAKLVEYGVEKTLAFATSAIRDAANGLEFVKEIETTTGLAIKIIDGSREAELIYIGNRGALDLSDTVSLIMDIGGGSNEFILCNRFRVFWKRSFRVGAARLLEMFPHQSPITEEEKNKIRTHLDQQLQPLFTAAADHPPLELIGSSGAFDSIVEMICGELNGEPFSFEKTAYHIQMDQFRQITEKVFGSSLEQRGEIKGLIPIRVDMMVISCLMIEHILSRLNINQMRVSSYSLKEGALLDFIQNEFKYYG